MTLVSLWTQTDFGGIFETIHIYVRYDGANNMQIEQHWVTPQTVPYSEQRNGNNKYYKETTELEIGRLRFHPSIDVRKEMEDTRLNAIKQLITFVKFWLNFSSKSTTAANTHLMESLLVNWLKNNHIIVDIMLPSDQYQLRTYPSPNPTVTLTY